MRRKLLSIFFVCNAIVGWVGWIAFPDDVSAWGKFLGNLSPYMTKENIIIALLGISSAGFTGMFLLPNIKIWWRQLIQWIGPMAITSAIHPVWVDWYADTLLMHNRAINDRHRRITIAGICIEGLNKTRKKIDVGKVTFDFYTRGKVLDGEVLHIAHDNPTHVGYINPKARFNIELRLKDGGVSGEYFLQSYCPFIVEIELNGKLKRKEYSVDTVRDLIISKIDRNIEDIHGHR